MKFPEIRMRQRRKDEVTRAKFRETAELSVKDFIMPIFVKEGISIKQEIKSMPGIFQLPLKEVAAYAKEIYRAGIPSVILFGIPKHKDDAGTSSYDDKGVVQEAIRAIKKRVPQVCVIADVCMCEYTSHGHCGIIKPVIGDGVLVMGKKSFLKPKTQNLKPNFNVDNDATIEVLAKIAVSYARAGVDIVAPSAMMDGQVQAIKKALIKNNFPKIKILAYSAKYASSLYEPFRDAAESPPQFGDRKAYQMDYHNSDEALLETKLDIQEGADMVMVKPALGYEDIIYRIKQELKSAGRQQLACYSVSGEYAMIKAASSKGYINEKKIVFELFIGFKRAGADYIITYYALEMAQWLKTKK